MPIVSSALCRSEWCPYGFGQIARVTKIAADLAAEAAMEGLQTEGKVTKILNYTVLDASKFEEVSMC